MKISEYIAALTANGLTEDAARGLAKGQATALSLVDDIGLTMPLASGLVKGLVTGGLSEATATEAARVAIAKGDAVDDLVVQAAEPVTADDAVSQLEAASAELLKGKKAQVEMDLNGDDEDDDEDGEDGDDDGKPDGLDGDDRGKRPDTPRDDRGQRRRKVRQDHEGRRRGRVCHGAGPPDHRGPPRRQVRGPHGASGRHRQGRRRPG